MAPPLHPRLAKRSRRGFRGFPAATVAFYGPDDGHATKAVVSIVPAKEAEPTTQATFTSASGDVREDRFLGDRLVDFVEKYGARSVLVAEEVLGCPHEEGTDYPAGETCPRCPFWAERDRWAAAKERLGGMKGEVLSRAVAEAREEAGEDDR